MKRLSGIVPLLVAALVITALMAGCTKQAPPMDSSTIAQHQAKKSDAPNHFH